MSGPELTDGQIAAMTPDERRTLIERLQRPLDDLVDPMRIKLAGRARFAVMVGGSVAMIPWIVMLSLTLPQRYVVDRWAVTWVGFDCLLVIMMALTAWFGWRRRLPFLLTAFATGVLLLCDAWFDVITASADDLWPAIATAAFAEIPLGVLLILTTLRILGLMAARSWTLRRGMHLWDVHLPG